MPQRKKRKPSGTVRASTRKRTRAAEAAQPLKPSTNAPQLCFAFCSKSGATGVFPSYEKCLAASRAALEARIKTFSTTAAAEAWLKRQKAANASAAQSAREREAARDAGDGDAASDTGTGEGADSECEEPVRRVVYAMGSVSPQRAGKTMGYGVFFEKHSPYNVSEQFFGPLPHAKLAHLKAAEEALCIISQHCLVARGGVIELHSGWQAVKNGLERWIDVWKRNGWRNSRNEDLMYKEIWKEIDNTRKALQRRGIRIEVVYRYIGKPTAGEQAASELATDGMEGPR